ncbi:MAG TPA: monovalent cation/H+ antiporter complex subunit F [Salinisphaeraceae bacterium]|nr:monovalent cation/H+ antiporter complex subunit F [Salinisphaeraceae bacterium]
MNIWLLAAVVLCVLVLLPGLIAACHGDALERLIGLQFATVAAIAVLVLVAYGLSRAIYLDTALVLALLSLAGGLVFSRFLSQSL